MDTKGFNISTTYDKYGFTNFVLENKHTVIKFGCKDYLNTTIRITNKKQKSDKVYYLSKVPKKYNDIINNIIITYRLEI